MVNDVSNLQSILKDYANLPEYSGLCEPTIHSKSLFGDYPINIASTRGIIDEIATLISHGADINAQGEHAYTPLHNAVEQGHIEAVKLLLSNNANVGLKTEDGNTPLELARLLDETEICHLLSNTK